MPSSVTVYAPPWRRTGTSHVATPAYSPYPTRLFDGANKTRCVTALTALEIGIDREAEMAASLAQFYGAAKALLLDSIRAIDLEQIAQLRGDLREISAAFRAAKQGTMQA